MATITAAAPTLIGLVRTLVKNLISQIEYGHEVGQVDVVVKDNIYFAEVELVRREPQKPPLGLKPRKIHDEERLLEVMGAIERHIESGNSVPREWWLELSELSSDPLLVATLPMTKGRRAS